MPEGLEKDVYQMCHIGNDPDALKYRKIEIDLVWEVCHMESH